MAIRTWNSPTNVNTTTLNNQSAAKVTALRSGGYVVAWVDDMGAGTSVVKFQRYDAFGRRVGVETTVPVAGGGVDHTSPSIASMNDGGFVIALQQGVSPSISDILAKRYDANGILINEYIIVKPNAGAAEQPTVVANGNAFNIFYKMDYVTDKDLYVNNFTSTGVQTTTSVDSRASVSGEHYGVVGIGNQEAVFVDNNQFTDGATVYGGRVYFKTVGFSTPPLEIYRIQDNLDQYDISEVELFAIENTSAAGKFVAIISLNKKAGNFSGVSHNVLLLNYEGIELADLTLLLPRSPYTSLANTVTPQISSLQDGSFAILYYSADSAIQLAHFSNTGALLGSAQLSFGTIGSIEDVSIAQLADGRLIATWTDNSGVDGSGQGVFQQIIDLRDGFVNGSNNAALAETLTGIDGLADFIHGFAGNDTLYGLSGADVLFGDAGADQLNGGRGDDTLYGGNDADSLNGEAGDDLLFGEAGSDRMSGGLGADELDGGAGDDGVSFRGAKAGVAVNLLTGVGTVGEAAGDTYLNMESFFGSEFADTVIGGAVAGGFYGFGGDDNITGTALGDRLIGGLGNDTMNGLGGIDRVYYDTSLTFVQVNLATNVNTGGEAQGDILSNIEEVSGSAFGDTIIGKAGNERFFGNAGNDRLDGGLGSDTLVGGTGKDTFVFAFGQSGQTATTLDIISDYAKGSLGIGDVIDYGSALTIGGSNLAATANEASIDATNGVASFAAGSGTTLTDTLSDIAARMSAAGDTIGEFAFFRTSVGGNFFQFISDGFAGVTTGDVVVQLNAVTTITTLDFTNGDVTILS